MNSPIKLPEGTYFSDANPSGPWFDADDMNAYAEQAAREALAVQATALRNFADRKYCVGIDYAMRNEALGWEQKVRTGRYGEAEFACHQRMNQAFGAYVGIYEALNACSPSQGEQP